MKINQLFSISFQSVLGNKLRTTLTLLGVVVGAAVGASMVIAFV